MVNVILTSNCNYDEFEAAVIHLNKWLDEKFQCFPSFGNGYLISDIGGFTPVAVAYFGNDNYLNKFIGYVEILDWSQESWVQLIISKGGPFEIISIRSDGNVS